MQNSLSSNVNAGHAVAAPVLDVTQVSVHFGGVAAVTDVSLSVHAGEILALVGENGAGKSTLLKVIFGEIRPNTGEVAIGADRQSPTNPRDAIKYGIAMIAQELALVPELTVAQNLFLGREPGALGVISGRAMRRQARQILCDVGFDDVPVDARVAQLRPAQRQMVEVARATDRGASLVIMDEPTSSLDAHDGARLMNVARGLRDRGTSVIYVSHRLSEVLELADRVAVLRDGQVVSVLDNAGLDEDRLVELMIGRPPTAKRRSVTDFGGRRLEVTDLVSRDGAHPVSLSVRAGEIVGVGGLVGSGRSSLARAIAGASRPPSGTVCVGDRRLQRLGSIRAALRAGIAFVPEDRRHEGLLLDASILRNASLTILRTCSRYGVVMPGRRREIVSRWTKSVALRARSLAMDAGQLSGGNQQKVVLAKMLATGSSVLIIDEPTRGIDVGAKEEIYGLLESWANEGNALLVVSSETAELVRLSDRVLVMRGGQVVSELAGTEITEERIGEAMLRTKK